MSSETADDVPDPGSETPAEFLERRRDELEAVADGDYRVSPYVRRYIDNVDGGESSGRI